MVRLPSLSGSRCRRLRSALLAIASSIVDLPRRADRLPLVAPSPLQKERLRSPDPSVGTGVCLRSVPPAIAFPDPQNDAFGPFGSNAPQVPRRRCTLDHPSCTEKDCRRFHRALRCSSAGGRWSPARGPATNGPCGRTIGSMGAADRVRRSGGRRGPPPRDPGRSARERCQLPLR